MASEATNFTLLGTLAVAMDLIPCTAGPRQLLGLLYAKW